jgi:hypothetical protein
MVARYRLRSPSPNYPADWEIVSAFGFHAFYTSRIVRRSRSFVLAMFCASNTSGLHHFLLGSFPSRLFRRPDVFGGVARYRLRSPSPNYPADWEIVSAFGSHASHTSRIVRRSRSFVLAMFCASNTSGLHHFLLASFPSCLFRRPDVFGGWWLVIAFGPHRQTIRRIGKS